MLFLKRFTLCVPFWLSILIIPLSAYAECGNGVIDPGEICDDGNNIQFDFCNNTCTGNIDIELVSIPGNTYFMGSDNGDRDEKPSHKVEINYNFRISKTEVTVAQYKVCVDAEECSLPYAGSGCTWNVPDSDLLPVNCINWAQATDFATFAGLRLPTEAEWEYVASGGGENTYPWGEDVPTCEHSVLRSCGLNQAQSVCTSEQAPRSIFENQTFAVCDLSGNVGEWVQDHYSLSYTNQHPVDGSAYITTDRRFKNYRVVRGGAWYNPLSFLRASDRFAQIFLYQRPNTGIRLVEDTTCGNTIVDEGEECDDGNLTDNDGCDSNCTETGCGNGIVNQDFNGDGLPDVDHPLFEYCDSRPIKGRGCLDNCNIDTCGDGEIQAIFGEQCDLGLGINSDDIPNTCRTNCRNPFCGDGVIDEGEECDNAGDNSDINPNACRTSCQLPTCGDGVTDEGEGCDDPNGNSDVLPNICRISCTPAGCNDGIIDEGEECDDPNGNSDVLPNICRTTCVQPTCLDGVPDDGEECDDGDQDDTNACRNNCEDAECGDGVQRTDLEPADDGYEPCDDGNDNQNDACLIGCINASCGDGFVRDDLNPDDLGFENCDDGNQGGLDGCSLICLIEDDFSCQNEPSFCFPDRDGDFVADADDNCIDKPNQDQADTDFDLIGDECDPSFDQDSDDVFDGRDNCPNHANSDQADFDNDGLGDACDDFDGDGTFDSIDNCRDFANPDQKNTDQELVDNGNFLIPGDDLGDACDDDDDNDGLLDVEEDADGDGVLDDEETSPISPDTDNDGIRDDVDNCIRVANANQLNTDQDLQAQGNFPVIGDVLGDVCDDDDDNDGALDIEEDPNSNGIHE
jgi:cysteine-rich repeat protein